MNSFLRPGESIVGAVMGLVRVIRQFFRKEELFGFDTGPKGLANWANAFTLSRLPIGVFGMVLAHQASVWSGLLVIALAALTDLFDGIVARVFGCASQFGEIFDPTVDKLGMGIIGTWALFWAGPFWWVVVVSLVIELAIAVYGIYALTKGVQIKTDMSGKWGIMWRALAIMLVIAANATPAIWNIGVFLLAFAAMCAGIRQGIVVGMKYHKQYRDAMPVKGQLA